jgi:hypothetical protein
MRRNVSVSVLAIAKIVTANVVVVANAAIAIAIVSVVNSIRGCPGFDVVIEEDSAGGLLQ